MAKKNKNKQESFVEEIQETVEEAIEDIQEDVEEVVEDVQEVVQEVIEYPTSIPLKNEMGGVKEDKETKPESSGKEHFDTSIQCKKAKVNDLAQQRFNAAISKADAKTAGSSDEVKDTTFNDTSSGGFVGTYQEDNRNSPIFYR